MGSVENNEPTEATPHKYDPAFTDKVIAATGSKAHARLAEVMPSLIRHLHDFARESNITVAEWTSGVEFINECGRMSDAKRNETQLLCDVLGLESLVDEITSKILADSSTITPSAILGPFYRDGAPDLPNGSSIVKELDPKLDWYDKAIEDATFMHGRVFSAPPKSTTDGTTGSSGTISKTSTDKVPLPGATISVWHTAPNGLYEQQDPQQPDMNLRGRFTTDDQGRYSFYCLRPVPYPVPNDGPAGRLLGLLDRKPYRPAHIHFLVEAQGHRTLVTQVFDGDDEWVEKDSVFAVKDGLSVTFEKREGDEKAQWQLGYDFVLAATGAGEDTA